MPEGAVDNTFADAEQPTLHVGDHVQDRESDDDEPILISGLPGETADEWVVDTFDATVAELNEEYPPTDEVVQVCYPQRTDTSLGLDMGESQTEYSFPRSRLQLETPIHNVEDGDRDE